MFQFSVSNTRIVGRNDTGDSYGVYWNDFNGDGLPDLWLPGHTETDANLLVNTAAGNGDRFNNRFANATDQIVRLQFNSETQRNEEVPVNLAGGVNEKDFHGAVWADFNNDGRQDFIQQTTSLGNGGVARFFSGIGPSSNRRILESENISPVLLRQPQTPILWDYNLDGNLDVLLSSQVPGLAGLYEQNPNDGSFSRVDNLSLATSTFGTISDIDGDGSAELLVIGAEDGPGESVGLKSVSFDGSNFDISTILPNAGAANRTVTDIAVGDFNGDLNPDIFLATEGRSDDLSLQPDERQLSAYLQLSAGGDHNKGFAFSTDDVSVAFDVQLAATNGAPDVEVFIGSSNQSLGTNGQYVITRGDILPPPASMTNGLYLGYHPGSGEFRAVLRGRNRRGYIIAQSAQPISGERALSFNLAAQQAQDYLLINDGNGGFTDQSNQLQTANGTAARTTARNVVSADFDNDGDLDLYVVNSGFAGNDPNIFYLNDGSGNFVVQNAGAARGTLLGLGEAAATADYNQDGKIDIALSNGRFFAGDGAEARTYFNDAPYQLLTNTLSEQNNSISINLEGRIAPRDGIGATVILESASGSQLREQSGGGHSRAQNSQQLHFGLGTDTVAQRIEVIWSSGTTQILRGQFAATTAANPTAIPLDIVEGIGNIGRDELIGSNQNDVLRGLGGRDTLEGNAGNDRLFAGGSPDLVDGGIGNDLLQGNGGNDTLRGGSGRDTLSGQDGNDYLVGGSGNDRLNGGPGQDTLAGGTGRDTLIGSGGADVFVFDAPNQGADDIIGFSNADRIEVNGAAFNGLPVGTLPASRLFIGTEPTGSGPAFVYNDATGALFFDGNGGVAGARSLLARLSLLNSNQIPTLSNQSIVVV